MIHNGIITNYKELKKYLVSEIVTMHTCFVLIQQETITAEALGEMFEL